MQVRTSLVAAATAITLLISSGCAVTRKQESLGA